MVDLTDDSPLTKTEKAKSLSPATRPERKTPQPSMARKEGDTKIPLHSSRKQLTSGVAQRPRPVSIKAMPVKMTADVGIQAETQEPLPVTPRAIVPRKRSTVSPSPIKSIPRIETSSVQQKKYSTTYFTSTPVPKRRSGKSPLIITKPPSIPRIRQRIVAPSPESVRSIRRRAPERINYNIVDVSRSWVGRQLAIEAEMKLGPQQDQRCRVEQD